MLKTIDASKATGGDGIRGNILKAAYTIDKPLFPIWGVSRQAKNCKNQTNFQRRGEI